MSTEEIIKEYNELINYMSVFDIINSSSLQNYKYDNLTRHQYNMFLSLKQKIHNICDTPIFVLPCLFGFYDILNDTYLSEKARHYEKINKINH